MGPQAPPTVSNSVDLDMVIDDTFCNPERYGSLSTSFMGKRQKKRVVLKRAYQRGGSVNQTNNKVAKSLTAMPAKYSTVVSQALDRSK